MLAGTKRSLVRQRAPAALLCGPFDTGPADALAEPHHIVVAQSDRRSTQVWFDSICRKPGGEDPEHALR